MSRIYSSSLPDCTKQDLWEGNWLSTYQLVTNRYLGVLPFSEVSLIGTEGGRGIHNAFWIVLSSSGSFFLSEYTEHSLGKEEHPRRAPSTSTICTGQARRCWRVPATFHQFGSSSKVRVTSQDLTMAMLCSQRESHTDGQGQGRGAVLVGLNQELHGQTPGKARCDAWLGSHQ